MAPDRRSRKSKMGSPKILRQRKVTKKLCRAVRKDLSECWNETNKENIPPGGKKVHYKSCDQLEGCGSCKTTSTRNKNVNLTNEEIAERNARERQRVHAVNDQYQVSPVILSFLLVLSTCTYKSKVILI